MGFGTYYVRETYFNRETFDALYKVKDAIEEETQIADMLKNQILNLAVMTEPKKFFNCDECDDLLELVTNKIDNLLTDYKDSILRLSELKDLEYHWDDCHTKVDDKVVGKYPPDPDKPYYLYGDFIETDNESEEYHPDERNIYYLGADHDESEGSEP